MEEKELKTSLKQRIFIGVIAFIMVGSMIASYAAIVISGNNSSTSAEATELPAERIAYYENIYTKELEEFKKATAGDYAKFAPYRSEIKAYNENTANGEGVKSRDLLTGTGRTLDEKDGDYLAYYVGWCADETIFDSSFDDNSNPTAFAKVLDVSVGMIEGWYKGVAGMKLGGIREITVPGELAYGNQMEICGGYSKPLKFLVYAVANEDPLKTASEEMEDAFLKLRYAYNGIDYETQMGS